MMYSCRIFSGQIYEKHLTWSINKILSPAYIRLFAGPSGKHGEFNGRPSPFHPVDIKYNTNL